MNSDLDDRQRTVPTRGPSAGGSCGPEAAFFSDSRVLDVGGLYRLARETGIEINEDYAKIIELVTQGKSVFITGPAGTGKSVLIRLLLASMGPGVAVCAPTGKAALQIGGRTLHSFFQLPPSLVAPGELSDPSYNKQATLRHLKAGIIDEVSMVRADLFDAVNDRLKRFGPHRGQPFGGIPMIIVGDLLQLPPVAKGDAREALKDIYKTAFFFGSSAWEELSPAVVELKKCYRQEDRRFYKILSAIRQGEHLERAVTEINQRCYETPSFDNNHVVLTCRRDTAERENRARLAGISDSPTIYEGNVELFAAELDQPVLPFSVTPSESEIRKALGVDLEDLPSPMELVLKAGASVMFTKNDPGGRWVNGAFGTVVALGPDFVNVRMAGTGECHAVVRERWESYECKYDRKEKRMTQRAIGRFVQFPLMLAWAITIHKAQGATLDRALIDLGDNGAFAEGQTYVALSRCRRIEDIRLARPLAVEDIKWSNEVSEFYRSLE